MVLKKNPLRFVVWGGLLCLWISACKDSNDAQTLDASDLEIDTGTRGGADSDFDTDSEAHNDTETVFTDDGGTDTGVDTELDSNTVGDAGADTASDSDVDTAIIMDAGADIDTDTDANMIADAGDDTETDADGGAVPDWKDSDGDGISDATEIGEDPLNPIDTDSDGTPDYLDLDSDDDTILDRVEGVGDFDKDGLPAYIDTDADGDCIPDKNEAGDDDVNTPPIDTDADFQYDFLDLDSDNDGQPDSLEDQNCNGIVDKGESSPIDDDSDDDGVSDLIEHAAGTDPTDADDNPQANGEFVFVVPYLDTPNPEDDTLDFSTEIAQADVVFAMDTTGSMNAQITSLKASVGTLIDTIREMIPNTGFAVVGYDDFPCDPYGSPISDEPFYLLHRVMTINGGAGSIADDMIQRAVNQYIPHDGGDGPESGWEMLHQIMSGEGTSECNADVPAFDTEIGPPIASAIPFGEEFGELGGVGFRDGSLPIIIWITDANNHNSENGFSPYHHEAATQESAIDELMDGEARVISVVAPMGMEADARNECLDAIYATDAVVPPEAWGEADERPASCPVDQCCTGQLGYGESPVNGQCPLIFSVDGTTGAGLGDSIAQAVQVLTTYAEFGVSGRPNDDPTDAVDAVEAFVERIEANVAGEAPCAPGMFAVDLIGTDGIKETFPDVKPGVTVCFDVIPKMNTTVEPLETPQMFKAEVIVEGDEITVLDTRTIYFLVPPEINDIPVV